MELTLEGLKKLEPCSAGRKWYVQNIKTENIREILLKVNDYKPEWAQWLFKKLITRDQAVKIAIFSAELVLPLFEEKYPEGKSPNEAIQAAKYYLENPNKESRKDAASSASSAYAASYDAAYAAADAAHAASSDAAASDAAYAAAYAAYAASDAAYAVSDAAYAAAYASSYAAYAASDAASASSYAAAKNKEEIQIKILNYVSDLLEKGE